jgi:hypothetical protein
LPVFTVQKDRGRFQADAVIARLWFVLVRSDGDKNISSPLFCSALKSKANDKNSESRQEAQI